MYANIPFNETPLPDDQYNIAKRLLTAVPRGLLRAEQEKFGMPDAHDQGAITIGVKIKGEQMQYWSIDTIESRLPDYLVPFVREVRAVSGDLR